MWQAHSCHVGGTTGPKSPRHGLLLWPVVSRFGSLECRVELGSARDKHCHGPSASPWHCCLINIAGWTYLDEVQYEEGRTGLLPRPGQCRLNHSHISPWLDFAYAKWPTVGGFAVCSCQNRDSVDEQDSWQLLSWLVVGSAVQLFAGCQTQVQEWILVSLSLTGVVCFLQHCKKSPSVTWLCASSMSLHHLSKSCRIPFFHQLFSGSASYFESKDAFAPLSHNLPQRPEHLLGLLGAAVVWIVRMVSALCFLANWKILANVLLSSCFCVG